MSNTFETKIEIEIGAGLDTDSKSVKALKYAGYIGVVLVAVNTNMLIIDAALLASVGAMEWFTRKPGTKFIEHTKMKSLETAASQDAAELFSNICELEQACLQGSSEVDVQVRATLIEVLRLMRLHEDNKHILATYLVAENYAITGILKALSQGMSIDNESIQLSLSQLLIGIEHAKQRLLERVGYNLEVERKVLQEVLETKIKK